MARGVQSVITEKEHWLFNENVERELRKELYKLLLDYDGDVVKLVNELLGIDKIMRGEKNE